MTYPMSTKRLLARFDRELKAHVSREKAVAALYRAYGEEECARILNWRRQDQ